MLAKPMDILSQYPIRKSANQQQDFRTSIQAFVKGLNYPVYQISSRDLLFGYPESSRYLITARQKNTAAVITLLEILRTMPETQRHKVCFVLYEAGMTSYYERYQKLMDSQLFIHLDAISTGDHLRMIPTKQLVQNRIKLTSLYKACGYFGNKSLLVHEKGFVINAPSQKSVTYGVAVCSMKKNKLYHSILRKTPQNSPVVDEINVNILRAALTSFICCDAVNQERKMKNETV